MKSVSVVGTNDRDALYQAYSRMKPGQMRCWHVQTLSQMEYEFPVNFPLEITRRDLTRICFHQKPVIVAPKHGKSL